MVFTKRSESDLVNHPVIIFSIDNIPMSESHRSTVQPLSSLQGTATIILMTTKNDRCHPCVTKRNYVYQV